MTYAHVDKDSLTLQLLSRVEALEKHDVQLKDIIGQQQEQLDQQTSRLTEQTGTIQKSIKQVDKLNVKVTELTVKVTNQQTQIAQQNTRLLIQEKWITQLELELKQHERVLSPLKGRVSTYKVTEEQNHENKGNIYANHTHEQESNLQFDLKKRQPKRLIPESPRQSRFITPAEGPVAFHAVITKGEMAHIGLGQNIIFDVIEINLGIGYHSRHVIFTAPQAGLYLFSTSILSYINAQSRVQVDKCSWARAFAHGDSGLNDQGSVTVVSQLKIGDEVWVSLTWPANTSLYGARYTSFMGCLIIPM